MLLPRAFAPLTGVYGQVFLNHPVLIAGDLRHSAREVRYYAFGFTDQARHLTIVFTPTRARRTALRKR